MISQNKLSLLLHRSIPAIEVAYAAGFEAAQHDEDIECNCYDKGSEEYSAWESGWWDGVYNESPLYAMPKEQVEVREAVTH